MTHQTLDYTKIIHQKGFRVTPQRQLILDAICEGHGHTSLEEIYNRVQAISSSVSLPTIYRTLNFLCEVKLIVNLQVKNKTYYEISGRHPHHHLICRKCGKIHNLSNDEVQRFFEAINSRREFLIDMDHLGLVGLCNDCRKNRTNL